MNQPNDFSSKLDKIEREYRAKVDAQLERLQNETREMEKENRASRERWMDEARSVSREAIFRITVLSASMSRSPRRCFR